MGNVSINQKSYLSITEAATFLGVSRPTIYLRMQSGELPYNQISSRTIRIPVDALRNLQSSSSAPKAQSKIKKDDLRNYITRDEVLKLYQIEKSKFHKVVAKHGVGSIRYGQKVLYPKTQIHEIFHKEIHPEVSEWYTTEELAAREQITRKHICTIAHKLGIAVKRAGSVCYIDKKGWDQRKFAPAVLEKNYMTVDQAKKHYHIGGHHFYEAINASNIEKVKRGNFVYFPIKDLDRLFKEKGPHIPEEIKRYYITAKEALAYCHVGQKRFTEETKRAGVTKIRTEGNFVWYNKEELRKLFKL